MVGRLEGSDDHWGPSQRRVANSTRKCWSTTPASQIAVVAVGDRLRVPIGPDGVRVRAVAKALEVGSTTFPMQATVARPLGRRSCVATGVAGATEGLDHHGAGISIAASRSE
jgi:hypothetical protein